MNARDEGAERAARLLDLIEAKWTTQAIGVAAELGLADRIAAGHATVESLAADAGCDTDALRRLVRALASLGLLTEDVTGLALTPTGELLRPEAPGSLHAWARWNATGHWQPWGQLLESVRHGKSARELAGTATGYAHLEADAGKAAIFNRAMTEVTALVADAVARGFDFSRAAKVADIGGGHGEMICTLLASHAHLRGVLFDMPHAMEGARERLAAAGLSSRCELVPGSFFEAVPARCDAYVLKSILHNWDDGRAVQILEACRRAMPAGARVLLVERVVPERLDGHEDGQRIVRADLNMLVSHAGRERTRAQYAALLSRCGMEIASCRPLAVGFSLVEAVGM